MMHRSSRRRTGPGAPHDLDEERDAGHASATRRRDTAGEIVVVVAGEASGYRAVPLLWALLGSARDALAADLDHRLSAPSRIFIDPARGGPRSSASLLSVPRRRYALVPRFDQAGPGPRGRHARVPGPRPHADPGAHRRADLSWRPPSTTRRSSPIPASPTGSIPRSGAKRSRNWSRRIKAGRAAERD